MQRERFDYCFVNVDQSDVATWHRACVSIDLAFPDCSGKPCHLLLLLRRKKNSPWLIRSSRQSSTKKTQIASSRHLRGSSSSPSFTLSLPRPYICCPPPIPLPHGSVRRCGGHGNDTWGASGHRAVALPGGRPHPHLRRQPWACPPVPCRRPNPEVCVLSSISIRCLMSIFLLSDPAVGGGLPNTAWVGTARTVMSGLRASTVSQVLQCPPFL